MGGRLEALIESWWGVTVVQSERGNYLRKRTGEFPVSRQYNYGLYPAHYVSQCDERKSSGVQWACFSVEPSRNNGRRNQNTENGPLTLTCMAKKQSNKFSPSVGGDEKGGVVKQALKL